MKGLLTYSGIATKVRAMSGKLLSDRDFHEMASLETVPQTVEFLKKQPSYGEIFQGMDEADMHRRQLEAHLFSAHYNDFAKLYRFSNQTLRRFLDLYFMRYETKLLKKCLHNLTSHTQSGSDLLDLSGFFPFFTRHSHIDWTKIMSASSMEEILAGLEGSVYCEPLRTLSSNGTQDLSEYEIQLDLVYLKIIWKEKDKLLSKKDREILTESYGCQIDMQNLIWIYRFKKYYHLEPYQIVPLLIPSSYRLKREEISALVNTENLDAFFALLDKTYYASWAKRLHLENYSNLESLSEAILDQVHTLNSRRNPYSIAALNSYLYKKEQEIQRIITVTEGIRYGIGTQEILQLIHIMM